MLVPGARRKGRALAGERLGKAGDRSALHGLGGKVVTGQPPYTNMSAVTHAITDTSYSSDEVNRRNSW